MVIYTLSSTDPQHFNRIQTKLPTELSSRFVNVCVTSLTSNCNIEVMNADDYITFVFHTDDGDTTRKVLMTPYSKLTSASLPYVLQDIFNRTSSTPTPFPSPSPSPTSTPSSSPPTPHSTSSTCPTT